MSKKNRSRRNSKVRKIDKKLQSKAMKSMVKRMDQKTSTEYPIATISYSDMALFCTNPILFRIKKINGEKLDTPMGISGVIGKAFHAAMESYYASDHLTDSDAVLAGLNTGTNYIENYPQHWIQYMKTLPTAEKAIERLVFAYNSYVEQYPRSSGGELLGMEERIETKVDTVFREKKLVLPIPLVGVIDRVVLDSEGRLCVIDYKTSTVYSDLDKIDGRKILQSITYYFLCLMEYGQAPYSMTYQEVKTTKNKDGSPQVREYTIVYDEHPMYFDFFLRFYGDMLLALAGEQVYLPNIDARYDNDISMVSYIYRLDEEEARAQLLAEHQVTSITELLKSKLQSAHTVDTLLSRMSDQLLSHVSITYDDMTTEDKIKTKFMEHGLLLSFDSQVTGPTVTQYRYTPSIGVRMKKVLGYQSDIEQVLGVTGVRILAPIPGTTYVGIEVPNTERLFPVIPSTPLDGLRFHVGESVDGTAVTYDLADAPHMLVAGASGSGKSVFLASLIRQLQTRNVGLCLFDPKQVELSMFTTSQTTYASDPEAIHIQLLYLVQEMEDRYTKLAKSQCRSASEYRAKNGQDSMESIVVIIDEFGDLVAHDKNIMTPLLLLSQKARAAGIHLVITTQRPSTDVIKGTVKANFPVKVLFRTAKAVDSMVVIDEAGGNQLLGKGDMLFSSEDGVQRLQGYAS